MALERSDPLERATRALRDEPEPTWPQVSSRVKGRVRSLVRPATPVLTVGPDGAPARDGAGSRTWVSSRVLVALVRERARHPEGVARGVEVTVADGRCRSVRVDLVCSYGVDLLDLGARVRADVRQVLHEVIGPEAGLDGSEAVEVAVVDVVRGDARLG